MLLAPLHSNLLWGICALSRRAHPRKWFSDLRQDSLRPGDYLLALLVALGAHLLLDVAVIFLELLLDIAVIFLDLAVVLLEPGRSLAAFCFRVWRLW